MSNEQKMEIVKAYLDGKGIKHDENHVSETCGVIIPLYIPEYRLAIHIGDDQEFFNAVKTSCFPIFIRDEDTDEKVMEKLRNTIAKSADIRDKEAVKARNKAYDEECWQRHMEKVARKEAVKKEMEEIRRRKEEKKAKAARPKRKRIVRYEKVYERKEK